METDLERLARQFIHDEVKPEVGAKIPWAPLLDCFEAWCSYYGSVVEVDRSTRSRVLQEALVDVGIAKTGSKGRHRAMHAVLYVGTPEEFLADIEECARLDALDQV